MSSRPTILFGERWDRYSTVTELWRSVHPQYDNLLAYDGPDIEGWMGVGALGEGDEEGIS